MKHQIETTLALALLTLTACGGGGSSSSSAPAAPVNSSSVVCDENNPGLPLKTTEELNALTPTFSDKSQLRFVILGDPGTGAVEQYRVAEAAQDYCESNGCDFAISMGDNFYTSGVSSIDDAQWEGSFEAPYRDMDFPIFNTLGNHDNSVGPGEGSMNSKGDFQVDYSHRCDRGDTYTWDIATQSSSSPDGFSPSGKHFMAGRFFTVDLGSAGGAPLLSLISVDANPIATPTDPDTRFTGSVYEAEQGAFIQNHLETSTARWKFAISHQPYLSNGVHGNAGEYDGTSSADAAAIIAGGGPGATATPAAAGERFKDFVEQYLCGDASNGFANHTDVFFHGHDHNQEVILPPDNRQSADTLRTWHCPKTLFGVFGASSSARPKKQSGTLAPVAIDNDGGGVGDGNTCEIASELGFSVVTVSATEFHTEIFSVTDAAGGTATGLLDQDGDFVLKCGYIHTKIL